MENERLYVSHEGMPITPKEIPGAAARLRSRSGLSMDKLARAIGLAGGSSWQRYEKDEREEYLPLAFTERLAAALVGLGQPPIARGEVMELAGYPTILDNTGEIQIDRASSGMAGTGLAPYGTRDLPILGQGRAGDDTYFFANDGSPSAFTFRPMELLNVRNGYAVYVNGDSMSPRFRHGELIFVDPNRPPAPGDDVVIQLHDGRGYIKELARRTNALVICRQHNPRGEIEYPADQVRAIHLIISATKVRV